MQRSVKRFAHINFNIPGIKPVGLKALSVLNTDDPDTTDLARIIELDPVIFGSVLACANSPLFGGISEIIDMRTALVRLGLKEIRRILFHVVLESAFRSDNAEINKLLRKLWTQNLSISLIMQRLIQDCPKVKVLPLEMISMVYPLGLMHVLGIPVLILNYFEKFSKFIQEGLNKPLPEIYAQEEKVFEGLDHFELGSVLIQRWGFPDYFSQIIQVYHQPEPDLPEYVLALHSLLRLARHVACEMGYCVLENTPQNYWLQGNCLDIESIDMVDVKIDVIEQLRKISAMFS